LSQGRLSKDERRIAALGEEYAKEESGLWRDQDGKTKQPVEKLYETNRRINERKQRE